MIFRVFDKKDLRTLFEIVAEKNRVVGPVEAGRDRNDQPVYAFSDISDYKELRLNYSTTKLPAKRFFLPFQEDLSTFRIDGDKWEKSVDYNVD